MQVFKAFFKILWKKKTTVFLYVGIFMGLAIGMSSLGGEKTDTSFQQEKYKIAVFDYDRSSASQAFVSYLSERTVPVEKEDDAEKLRDQLFVRNIVAVIYVKDGYEEQIKTGNVENLIDVTTLPGSVYNQTILNYVNQYMSTLHTYLEIGEEPEKAIGKTAEIMNSKTDVVFSDKQAAAGKSKLYYYMLYIPYVLISVSILVVGSCIMVFQRKELKDRMNISSASLWKRSVGLWSGCVLAELVMTAFFVLVAVFMYGKSMMTAAGAYAVLNMFTYMLVCFGITCLMGVLMKTEAALSMAGNVIGLSFSFLGGIFVTLDVMGEGVRKFAHVIPAYWYVRALDVVEEGKMKTGAGEYRMALGIQILFAVGFLGLSLLVMRRKRRES